MKTSKSHQTVFLLALFLATGVTTLAETEPQHGSFRGEQVFDSGSNSWVTPMAFWQNYAAKKGGLTHGVSVEYPDYDDVREFDTLIIQLEQGPCLMEFFHSRWRRANDVRRWDPEFNEVLGCPHVFE